MISLLLDTNVLVYAHDEASPYHGDSVLLVELALAGAVRGVVAEQNLLELYRVLTDGRAMRGKPLTPEDAAGLVRRTYLSGRIHVALPPADIVDRTLTLARNCGATSLRVFDMRLSAQALASRVDMLVTCDTGDLRGVQGLVVVTPAEAVAYLCR